MCYEFLHSHCGGSLRKVEVMKSLDGRHFAEVDAQKGCPVKCWHNHFAVFSAAQLGNVDGRRLSDHSCNVIQAVNLGLPVQILNETKTPVTAEIRYGQSAGRTVRSSCAGKSGLATSDTASGKYFCFGHNSCQRGDAHHVHTIHTSQRRNAATTPHSWHPSQC